MKPVIEPARTSRATVADVERLAMDLFVFGSYASKVSARLCVIHGVGPVLQALDRERRRAELTGGWGRWGHVLADVRSRLPGAPPRPRRKKGRPFPLPESPASPGPSPAFSRPPRRTPS